MSVSTPVSTPTQAATVPMAVVNCNKPEGWTSHDVVAKLRGTLAKKLGLAQRRVKVGHLGTLDPMVNGVLPLCVGPATRLVEYFPSHKEYLATITLGITTDTLDAEGTILNETPCQLPTPEALEAALEPLRGGYEQRVPEYSAVKIGGKKLYHYARKGQPLPETVEIPSRWVGINELVVEKLEAGTQPRITLRIACTAGMYVRSLARDVGEALGCGAHLASLTRLRKGPFQLEDSVAMETILADLEAWEPGQPWPHWLQDPATFLEMPIIRLGGSLYAERLKRFVSGNPVRFAMDEQSILGLLKLKGNSLAAVTDAKGSLRGIAEWRGKALRPLKIMTG